MLCGFVGLAGSSRIGKHCVLAGGSGVGGDQPVTLCDQVTLTAGTIVTSSIDKPGVYFLIGESLTEHSKKSLYIGEAEKVSDRLSTHQSDREKDFWTKTIVFVSNDGSLNKADVKFLESELIKQAKIVDSWQVLNVKNSVLNSLSEADTIKTRDFLKVLLQIAPLIDLDAFEGSSLKGLTKLYISGPGCKGQGEDQAGGFLVLKGSLFRKDGTTSFPERFKALRQSLIMW